MANHRGVCPACKTFVMHRAHHHIVPRSLSKKKRSKNERIDILFPEHFPEGRKEKILICVECHTKFHNLIPYDKMLTPECYRQLLDIFIIAEDIPRPVIDRMIEESENIIKARQEKLFGELGETYFPRAQELSPALA